MKAWKLNDLPAHIKAQVDQQLDEKSNLQRADTPACRSMNFTAEYPCAPYGEREAAITRRVYLPVTPLGKPRMTQRDKWAKRPAVVRYRDYCDAVRKHWPEIPFPAAGASLAFHLPMPRSWSKKKRLEMIGKGHQQKPDIDNLVKALLDALHIEDKHIYHLADTGKWWSDAGYIEVLINNPDKS